jgi:protein involved in polysaccharide export with SLBB domain
LNGIPVRRLPTEILTCPRRENLQTLPLSLLRQEQPDEYLLGAGDVLGIYIPGVLPQTFDAQQLPLPPVTYPARIDQTGHGLPPALGYPMTVRKDGTIALPLIAPVRVEGLSVEQANEQIRQAYLDQGILPEGRDSVLVTLMQPRQVRVLVFRQEVGGFASGGLGDIATSSVKQGTGHVVDLRAYENDLLNALSYTGGLPGLDAYDGIFIFRGGLSNAELTERLRNPTPVGDPMSWTDLNVEIVHIPTRWPAWEPIPFQPEDIVLDQGDVVFIESRTRDYFYTGGLLPRGEYPVPRDYDLDVLEAVAQVRGTLLNGAFGGNNLNGLLIQPGIGNPNPSALTVVRRSPNGGQIPISVDLNRALRDPRERILVQPGDVLILQETTGEALARYFTNVFSFGFASNVIQRGSTTGTTAFTVP